MIYPPIIATFMPAFDFNKPVRVYFAISTYDSIADIVQAQVTVHYQTDNRNALDTTTYPNKIKTCSITNVTPQDDATIAATLHHYYITIAPSDLVTGGFVPDTIYKVQIRFSTKAWDGTTASATDLASTASEWSTVCLIKPIEVPSFFIPTLDENIQTSLDEEVSIILATVEPDFMGTYIPVSPAETLKYWRMRLYNESGTILLADTGQVAVNNYQSDGGRLSFEGHLKYLMSSNTVYQLTFDIETKNGYTASKSYTFTAMAYASGLINGTLDLDINEEDGYAQVVLHGDGTIVHTNVTLRRTSSKSNFTVWEDIANKTFENSTMDWEFDDFSIQSGVFYQYGAQTRDNRGRRSGMIKTEQEMGQFEDAFLTEKGQSKDEAVQLKIRYDMNISNMIVNVGEARTDTIGSKYPYVRRNGNMYYHSFPFSFLITAYTDNNHIFANEKELRDNQISLYQTAHAGKVLSVYNGMYDHIYERQFREKVEAFLYDDKVKLFRSLTEGNMLIKLMQITLTPKPELGRLLYSVEATAVEIDEPTIERLDYYGIQQIGTYNPNIVFNEAKLAQLNKIRTDWNSQGELITIEEQFPGGVNLMDTIKNKYHYKAILDGVKTEDLYLSHFRIEIDSQPYLIKSENGVLVPFDDIVTETDLSQDTYNKNVLLGTLININGQTILIEQPNNIYEIKGDNVRIGTGWNITPLKNTKMTINFAISLSMSNDTSRIATTLIYKNINGQLAGTFNSRISLRTQIWYKYYLDFYDLLAIEEGRPIEKPYYVRVNSFYNMNLESEPGVVFYAKSNIDTQLRRFVIDQTGELFVDPGEDNGVIEEIYFYGRNIEKRKLTNWDSIPEIPLDFDKYEDDQNVVHIFYHGQWYIGTSQDNNSSYDIPCPVDGLVNYFIQTEKGIY